MTHKIIKSVFDPKYQYVFLFSRVDDRLVLNSVHKTEDEERRKTWEYAQLYQNEHDRQINEHYEKILKEEEQERAVDMLLGAHDITTEAIRVINETRNN